MLTEHSANSLKIIGPNVFKTIEYDSISEFFSIQWLSKCGPRATNDIIWELVRTSNSRILSKNHQLRNNRGRTSNLCLNQPSRRFRCGLMLESYCFTSPNKSEIFGRYQNNQLIWSILFKQLVYILNNKNESNWFLE